MPESRKQTVAEFKKMLVIDRDDLDTELAYQAHKFYEVTENLSYAISRRDDCKLELERKAAELDKDIRASFEKQEKKATDKAVNAQVEMDKSYIKLRDELLVLSREVGEWSAMKEAFSQRSTGLRDLCNLYSANYFTKTSVKGSAGAKEDADAARVREVQGRRRRGEN